MRPLRPVSTHGPTLPLRLWSAAALQMILSPMRSLIRPSCTSRLEDRCLRSRREKTIVANPIADLLDADPSVDRHVDRGMRTGRSDRTTSLCSTRQQLSQFPQLHRRLRLRLSLMFRILFRLLQRLIPPSHWPRRRTTCIPLVWPRIPLLPRPLQANTSLLLPLRSPHLLHR